MIRLKIATLSILLALSCSLYAQDALLTGTPMGSAPSVDYATGDSTRTKNLPANAFDGDTTTYYASYVRTGTWVGLDLGSKHVITRLGWCPRNSTQGRERMVLGVFEGANREDFMDAIPLYVIPRMDTVTHRAYADIDCSQGFRYVRYVGPNNGRCTVTEIEIYGHEGEGDLTHLYRPTNLPCVVIHTVDNQEPFDKETYIESMVTILSEGTDNGSQTVILQDTAGIRLRGNASLIFPKKPYRIKFAHKQRVLNAPAKAKNWVLVNNYGDKTLMRNIVAFRVSEIFGMPYTPFCQAVDVFVNGEYKGCYQLCDKVEVKKNRIDITEMLPTDTIGEALTGGYMWEIDGNARKEPNPYYSPHKMPITLHSPKDDQIVPAQRAYFENYFDSLENYVYQASETDTTWRRYIDYSTFVRYFLINNVCANPDAYWQCYMYKNRSELKAYTGPVWDFDLAFDNDKRQYPMCEQQTFILSAAANTWAFVTHILYADQWTRNQMIAHWHMAREAGLDAETLCTFVDSVAQVLDASQELNFKRWKILSKCVHQNPVALGSYSDEVERLKEFIANRINWMDMMLGYDPDSFDPNQLSSVEHIAADQSDYRVFDAHGRMVHSGAHLPNLPTGLYIIQHNGKATKILLP